MELLEAARSVRRHWMVAVGVFALALAGVAAYLAMADEIRVERTWRGSSTLLVPRPSDEGVRPEGMPASLLSGLRFTNPTPTKEALAQQFELSPTETEELDLSAGLSEARDIVTLRVSAPSEELANAALDRYVADYVGQRRQAVRSSRESERTTTRAALDSLGDRLATVERELRAAGVSAPAIVPVSDDQPVLLDLPTDLPLDTLLLAYERNTLVNRIQEARVRHANAAANVLVPSSFTEIIERTDVYAFDSDAASPLVPIGGGLAAGLLLALAIPIAIDRLDRTIRSATVAAGALGAPVLATIPASRTEREVATVGTPRDAAFRTLAAASIATDRLPSVIMVTSPTGDAHEGVAANFAIALADLGLGVALLPTSMSQSWIVPEHEDDDSSPVAALPRLLEQAHLGKLTDVSVFESLLETPVDNLRVLPPGTADDISPALDGLPSLLYVLGEAAFDVVVIAGPPLLDDPNATIFAWAARNVLWAVRSGQVTQETARHAADRLQLAGVTPFGVALIGPTH